MISWNIYKKSPKYVEKFLQCWAVPEESLLCFDYFDTLVTRKVEPEHTKRIVSALLGRLLQSTIGCAELYARRQQLELQLTRVSIDSKGEIEFNLVELAQRLYVQLDQAYPDIFKRWDINRFVKNVIALELAVEKAVQEPCFPVVELARSLKQSGYDLILVSDFYLPKEYFHEMVSTIGLADLFDKIYVSVDCLMSKGSGRIYDKIMSDYCIDPKKLCMIGDNQHADIAMAAARGLKTVHVINKNQHLYYDKLLKSRNYLSPASFFDTQFMRSEPFSEMGISLWFFTWRLLQELLRLGISNVFFFSKEGEFLRRLFDAMQEQVLGHRTVKSHYLLVSRKSTFLASLRPLEQEDFHRIFCHYHDISLRDFLLSLNFDEKWSRNVCESLGLNFEISIQNFPASYEFMLLLSSSIFCQKYEDERICQRNNFLSYFNSFSVDCIRDGLTIVDVGWKGSIQDNLYWIHDGNIDIQGYYIGSIQATELTNFNKKKGLLFDDRPISSLYFDVYNNNRSLFEILLGATHGSADGYYTIKQWQEMNVDNCQHVFTSVTFDNNDYLVIARDMPEERQLFKSIISPLQDIFFEIASDFNRRLILSKGYIPSDEWFARCHARMVFRPSQVEVDLFSKLYHLENFGIFGFTDFDIRKTTRIFQKVNHLLKVLKSPELLESGVWPPIILMRLGIGWYRYIDGIVRFRRFFN